NVRVLPVDGPAGPDELLSVVDRDALDRAFRRLSIEQRAVFVLHHHQGLALVEIADSLGIPAGTARSRLHYATRVLRAAIEADAAPVAPEGRMA
ncbi:MAG: sigL 1, partial [Chloroflexota bacterium]|nr:sigL 1 [Chloroflexota bacterium]